MAARALGWNRLSAGNKPGPALPGTVPRGGLWTALLTPAHQFRTGVVLAPERRKQLLDRAAGGRLISKDDYDAEYRHDRAPVPAPQASAPDLRTKTRPSPSSPETPIPRYALNGVRNANQQIRRLRCRAAAAPAGRPGSGRTWSPGRPGHRRDWCWQRWPCGQ